MNLKVTYMMVGDLIPYARNARTHDELQIAQIAGSISEFGFNNPVLLDDEKKIIAGHGRVLAAQKLGLEKIPTITLGHLTDAQRRAYTIADNKIAISAGWDNELLALEMKELAIENIDMELLGFGEEEIARLLAELDKNDGVTDEDDTPELQSEAVSKVGDIWRLGRHRLMCGDSTRAEDVEALLSGIQPHLMVTDPPYGVEYDPNWRISTVNSAGSVSARGRVFNDDNADWIEAFALFNGDVAYVWHAPGELQVAVHDALVKNGFQCRNHIIWVKSKLVIGRGHYHHQHEPCWYAVRSGGTGHWSGSRKETTTWFIDKPHKSETGHSTQKPVECMRRPIENNSSPGQAVYDPFSGSGTTIIAAEMTGRQCLAMEISPNYVDMAVRRWQEFSGDKATNEETGGGIRLSNEFVVVASCGHPGDKATNEDNELVVVASCGHIE